MWERQAAEALTANLCTLEGIIDRAGALVFFLVCDIDDGDDDDDEEENVVGDSKGTVTFPIMDG